MHHKSSDRQGINPLILVTILVATPAHSTSIQQFQGVSRRSPAVRAQNPPNKLEVGLTVPTACSVIARRKEEMGMDMDEIRMILAVRALRKLLNKGERGDGDELVAVYRALGEAIIENKPLTERTAPASPNIFAKPDGKTQSAQPRREPRRDVTTARSRRLP
jgi:hypothetical protein